MTQASARLPALGRALRVRRVRVQLAATLAAFAAAGLYASAQAAAQTPGAAAPTGCGGGDVRWAYETTLVPGPDGGFSIDGIRMDAVPAACVGRRVAITYSAGATVVRTAVATLSEGVIDRVDRSATGAVVVTSAAWAPLP